MMLLWFWEVPPCEMGCDPHIPTGQPAQMHYAAACVRFSMYWQRQSVPHICDMPRNIVIRFEIPYKVWIPVVVSAHPSERYQSRD